MHEVKALFYSAFAQLLLYWWEEKQLHVRFGEKATSELLTSSAAEVKPVPEPEGLSLAELEPMPLALPMPINDFLKELVYKFKLS